MKMGEKTFSEKQNMGCSTNDESISETIIEMPQKLPDLGESCPTENVNFNKVVESKESWVVNVNCEDGESFEGEKVCRICHLDCEKPLKSVSPRSKTDLIMLGCGCKGELSVAHSHCAEAWFKLKGNRTCEICGQTVTNVRGVGDEGFMDEWKANRSNDNATDLSGRSEEEGSWHGQPLCNFLMACLVIAFIIPWFFRINLW